MAMTMEQTEAMAARPRGDGNTDRYSGLVGLAIRARRDALNLSAEQFLVKLRADGMDLKLSTIYGWETGRNAIPLDALPSIARVLKTTVRKLLPAE